MGPSSYHTSYLATTNPEWTTQSTPWSRTYEGNGTQSRVVARCQTVRKAPPAAPLFPWSWPTIPWQHINRLCHTSSQSLPCHCWCTLKVAWDYRSKEDHQLGGNNNHPAQQDMVSNSSYQQQRTTLSVFWIWRVTQTKRHTADISLTLTSSFQWISRKICSNLQVLLGIISLWSWFSASEDTELPTLIQEHSSCHNRIFPIQAVLATRAKDKDILCKTWPSKPRGNPTGQDEGVLWQTS